MQQQAKADQRLVGLTMVLAATLLWSTAGLFVRMTDLDVWTVLGWRSLFAAMALAVIVYLQKPEPAPASQLVYWAIVPIAVVSMGAYVISLKLTSVANVMVIYATVPLLAAGLAWVAMGERPTFSTLGASILALIGVMVMVGGAMGDRDSLGIIIAAAMTLAMGTQIVLSRKYPNINMAFANMLAALICATIGLVIAQAPIPSPRDLLVLMLFGVSNTALAYYFVLRGARLIPSVEVGLISTLDVVLGPLWVWLIFNEDPGQRTLIGGAIVLVAILGYLLYQNQRPRAE